jgi:hypothetical protein
MPSGETTFCPQCEEVHDAALVYCPYCDTRNGNQDHAAALEAALRAARQAPIDPRGMSFPNFCAMCGSKWSINHECKKAGGQ